VGMNSLGRAELAQEEFVGLSADSCFKMLSLGTLIPAVRNEDWWPDRRQCPPRVVPTVSALAVSVDHNPYRPLPTSPFVLCISITYSALSCAVASGLPAVSSEAVLTNRNHGRSRAGEVCLRSPQILSPPAMRTGFPHLRMNGPRP